MTEPDSGDSTARITVVGGGLAGLGLALGLRKRGISVQVLEAGTYPRHRVCGEFISGVAGHTLQTLGIGDAMDDALHLYGIVWYRGATLVRRDRLPRPALALSRAALDARLAIKFTNAGGELVTGRREREEDAPGRVHCHGRTPHARSNWTGLKAHATGYPLEADLELHIGPKGYCGVSRLPEGRVNICGLFHREVLGTGRGVDLLASTLERTGLPKLVRRLTVAHWVEETFCSVSGLAYQPPPPHPTARIGDRFGLIPPFTGNGMSLAFESAEVAVDPLCRFARGEADWEQTKNALQQALDHAFATRLRAARLLHRALLHPLGQGLIARLAAQPLFPFGALYRLTH
ncbi:MAG: NAD(P)/FAD-dependent oxidoreductase [Opitutales bacterium]